MIAFVTTLKVFLECRNFTRIGLFLKNHRNQFIFFMKNAGTKLHTAKPEAYASAAFRARSLLACDMAD